MLKIDVHSHWLPKSYVELAARGEFGDLVKILSTNEGEILEAGGRTLGQPLRTAVTSQLVDMDVQLSDMEKAQRDRVLVSLQPFTFHYEGDSKTVSQIHRMLNDELAKVIQAQAGKLYGLAHVPMQDVEAAISELRRIMSLPGMVGVQLGSNVNGSYLGEKEFMPFFEVAEKLGAFILIHPTNVAGADRLKKFYFRNLIGNPLDTTICAASLIFEGVMERLPGLKICLCHAGGHIPFIFGRLDHGYKVRPEAKTIPNPPSSYLKSFYYDIIAHSKAGLAYLIALVGAERVVLGTDYPFDMGVEVPMRLLNEIALTEQERDLICHGNVNRLLNI